mgnify:CR=1 FL=1
MIQQRLDRRLILLRGKRNGAFDPDQRYYESAPRARAARQLRVMLRRMQPATVVTPRWSQARRFLDDLSGDVMIGEPSVLCRTLSLLPLEGRTPHQAWAWLVQAITEFCHLDLEGPAWQVVSRRGFRHVMTDLLRRADHGQRRCLMIHGAEHIHVEALRDLISVLENHIAERTEEPRFNLLLAGAVDANHFHIAGCRRLTLPDYGTDEAVGNLVESTGPIDHGLLESVVEIVGGVPAFLDVLGQDSSRLTELLVDREAVWRLLGSIALDVRSAVEILQAEDDTFDRLEALAKGPLPTQPLDGRLYTAGLVRREEGQTSLRASILGDLVRSFS